MKIYAAIKLEITGFKLYPYTLHLVISNDVRAIRILKNCIIQIMIGTSEICLHFIFV